MAATTTMDKPAPKDLSYHYSRVTKNRVPSKMKSFYQYFFIPGIGNLAGGLPNPSYFPYDTLEAATATPDRFKPTPNDPVDPPTERLAKATLSDGVKASRVLVPHDSAESNILRKIDLTTALQYGTAQGYPPLYTFIRSFAQTNLHPNTPYEGGPEVILTCGSTDAFAKTLECFTNIWDEERDWIREREGLLCEEFAYMNAIQAARPRGLNVVPVAIDDEGMLAFGKGGLYEVLENWDKNKGKRPHIMYTVTMGQNPTSGLLSVKRRKEIYSVCQKYDIIIAEDDPYWYLQYPSANDLSIKARGKPVSENFPSVSTHNYNTASGGISSGFDFLDSLVPSYLSIDVDGRVVRMDTFSKTVAPGCRLGWITAQPAVCAKIQQITETSTQQPSGFVQSLIVELLAGPSSKADSGKGGSKDGSGWKVDGWVRWLEGLRGNYERRMQLMSSILEDGKFLIQDGRRRSTVSEDEDDYQMLHKTQLYDFAYPMAGMFLWMRAHYETHPLYRKVDHQRLARALWTFMTTDDYLVLLSPGSIFCPTQQIMEEKGWQYFRLCFAAVDDDVLEKHSKAVVSAFTDFWAIEDVKTIDKLLEDEEAAQARFDKIAAQNQGLYAVNPIIC
ncbi:aromatic amino acid aminotransferase [Exophiala viscosa]|uniref:Aromatic amino acid aminotransferase n=1 Tax=Exophiala viscosa TaxID=2486360 RepID=A0AAN6IHK5_9EURO|nr:aromatic amino acid aminotransferase [Exophiala viscosa]